MQRYLPFMGHRVISLHGSNVVHWSRKCNPLRYSCLENPTDNMKRQKDVTTEDENPLDWKVSSVLLGKSRGQLLVAPVRMKRLGQSRNDVQLWMCLVVKGKSDVVKNNTA